MAIKLIDLSHNNTVESFHAVQAAGYSGVYLKCSQGVSFLDPAYEGFCDRCDEINLPHGAYHFFDSTNPVQQVSFFFNHAKIRPGNLIPMWDVETVFPGVGPQSATAMWALKKLCGHYPIGYSNLSMYLQYLKTYWPTAITTWIADYGQAQQNPTIIASNIWQYSETGVVPGVTGNCDLDLLHGSIADLDALIIK